MLRIVPLSSTCCVMTLLAIPPETVPMEITAGCIGSMRRETMPWIALMTWPRI